MNKRIKELADTAELTKGVWAVPDFIYGRFALSIIEEIISEMESNKQCDPYTGEEYKNQYNAAIDEQIKVIAECFGIDNERTN